MAIWTVDYAYLSAMAYRRWEVGQETNAADSPSGYRYRVVEIRDDPSGYYGVIFQNLSTLEYVVAHCGTEFSGEYEDRVRDLLMTDGQMALLDLNQQKGAALSLVERALTLASENGNVPSVTVTGHSLGGALAQITAARFGLFGETFNACGAAAQIEEIHADVHVINHSRVSDIVSKALLRFGYRSSPRRRKSPFFSGVGGDSRFRGSGRWKHVRWNRGTPEISLGARALFFACTLVVLAACGKYEPPKPPNVEWNEHPVDAYVATLEVEGLEEPYTVTATGQFMIKNRRECLPVDKGRSLGGSRHFYHETQEIPVVRASNNLYRIVFYADAIKSDNYYGLGECVWHGSPIFEIRRTKSRDVYSVSIHNSREEGKLIRRHCLSHAISAIDVSRLCSIAESSDAPGSRESFIVSTTFTKE